MADTTLPPGAAQSMLATIFQALAGGGSQGAGSLPYQFQPGPPADPSYTAPAATPPPGYDPTPFQFRPPSATNPQPGLTSPFQGDLSDIASTLGRPYRPGEANIGFGPIGSLITGLRSIDGMLRNQATAGVEPFDVDGPPKPGEETPAADADKPMIPFDVSSIPVPPTIEAPPSVNLDDMRSSRRNSVLGALASGAAQVDPTEPGAFARALASAGGSGASAAAASEDRMVEIAHQNALAAYQTSIKNKELEYGHKLKLSELMLPKVEVTDGSVVIQEHDPEKKGYNVRVINTGPIMKDAEKLGKFIEGTGASGPVAELIQVKYLASQYKDDPAGLQTVLLRTALERTIDAGIGSAVFKDKFTNIEEDVKKELVPYMRDPEVYRREYSKRMAAKLLTDPEIVGKTDWLSSAGSYGILTARILAQGGLNDGLTN